MKNKIKNQQDFFSGLLFLIIGAAFAIGAKEYQIGTAARMQAGYFPLLLGILLSIIGVTLSIKSCIISNNNGQIGKWAIKPLFWIILANMAFGTLLGGINTINLPSMGLIIAIYALVIISSLAMPDFKIKPTLILATILAAGSYLVFIKWLDLGLPAFPEI